MTSPSNEPKVYTDAKIEENQKERLVECIRCKYQVMTNLPGPKCGHCKSYLITVLH